ncbi:MAG: tetratricopeptide repeat protein [Acidobacteriota bacterium]
MKTLDWLRLLLMIFYAPGRGLREVRDRASLVSASLLALTIHVAFLLVMIALFVPDLVSVRHPLSILLVIFQSAGCLLFLALVFIPVAILLLNMGERRGSYRLVMQQEYTTTAATLFYGWAAASLITLLFTLAGTASGVLQKIGADTYQAFTLQQSQMTPESLTRIEFLLNPRAFSGFLPLLIFSFVFAVFAVAAIQVVFKTSGLRALVIVIFSGAVLFPAFLFLQPIFSMLLSSPFLLLMVFFLLRGYLGEATRNQRARASFKQNLEAATLNPADASAHYNLGLIHQQRGELDAARERFERAIQIDEDEVDAHYQLGRIALQQKRLADAIKNFEQVVARDQSHSQHEIWREVGATYLAAVQFEDARDALDRFLENRPSDPEGLYLIGRAHAGLGHRREAASSMQACIEAVKTAPAYKYRADKRWLNEAQQFIKGSQQTVDSKQ